MHGWFGWEHAVWMTIAWLTAVGLLLTLVWSIVLSAGLRYQQRKSPEATLKPRDTALESEMDEYERNLEDLEKRKAA